MEIRSVITHAESIQRPDAAIFQGYCHLPLDRCVAHIKERLEAPYRLMIDPEAPAA